MDRDDPADTTDVIGTPVAWAKSGAMPMYRPDGGAELVGHSVGPYELTRLLGRGSTSLVFAASHDSGAEVALKLFAARDTHLLSCVRAVHIEAERVASVAHPNVVAVHEVIEAGEWVAMVMERYTGPTLQALVAREGPLSVREALALLLQLADALRAIHRAGLVHRDIKPSNVMVDGPSEAPRAVLIDFGVAKLQGSAHGTPPSGFCGTPAYAAPEQTQSPATVGPAADLYGLGGVLYYMLTGRTPFGGSRSTALVEQHISAPFPMLLSDEVKDPAARRACNTLLWRMTAKAVEGRYASAGGLAIATIIHMDALGYPVSATRSVPRR